MSREEDPKIVARNERKRPETEKLLRQFLKTDGPKGNTSDYNRRHDYTFSKDQAFKDEVTALMETHDYSFDEAYALANGERDE